MLVKSDTSRMKQVIQELDENTDVQYSPLERS